MNRFMGLLLIFVLISCDDFTVKVKSGRVVTTPGSDLYEAFDGTSLDSSKWGYGWNSVTTFPAQPSRVSIGSDLLTLNYVGSDPAWQCPAIY